MYLNIETTTRGNNSTYNVFINAGNEYGESEVIDLTSDENTIKFGWAIDNYVTRYSGIIQFTVQFETEDKGIQYQWQTTPAKLTILAALDIESTITDKDDVLFRTLSNQIIALQQQIASLENQLFKWHSKLKSLSINKKIHLSSIFY